MKHVNVSLFVPHLGCPNNCIFCNQKTISGKTEPLKTEDIISALSIAMKGNYNACESEIAFFGGSFTAIERDEMISFLETAKPYVGKYFKGIRISTRPDCIDEEILTVLKSYGVTSIELGAQSMSDKVLELNQRGHTKEDTEKACKLIKEYGFSPGLQMMTGLYGSDSLTDLYTADCFINLRPDTVRIYPTVVLENTYLATLYRERKYIPPTLEESVALCSSLLLKFHKENIKVIRTGLHSGGNVEEGFVAGVYHPAFKELCESEIYKKALEEKLFPLKKGEYTVFASPSEISKVLGHKKSNKEYMEKLGYILKVKAKDGVGKYTVEIDA